MTAQIGHRPLVSAPALAAPELDPTASLVESPVGRLLENRSGDLCSLLGIAGAAGILVGRRVPGAERVGERVILGSLAAAGADTALQSRSMAYGDAQAGDVAYAATGLIPAVSVAAIRGLHPHPTGREVTGLALLALNSGVLGYELITRAPKIARGEEDLSGYGSLLASFGGFVVAQHLVRR